MHPREPGGQGRFRFAILAATVAAFLLVPAAQASASESLKVNIAGNGHGDVRSGPNAKEHPANSGYWGTSPYIECEGPPATPIGPGTCETEMLEPEPGYEQVYLFQEPDPGSEFVKWTVENYESEGCGTFTSCLPYVEPSGTGGNNGVVTALFCNEGESEAECLVPPVPKQPLTVLKEGGEGTVVSSPAGIECGGTCSAEFEEGSKVKLTASPAAGYAFLSWSGCETHVGLTCTVTMSSAKTVKAKFFKTWALTIEPTGSGTGKVTSKGISCDANCSVASSEIKAGSLVEVKVKPDKGSEEATFESGTGSASACSSSCSFTISEDSSVVVRFEAIPKKDVTVNLTGPGAYKGKVKGKAFVKGTTLSGVLCGAGCTSATEAFFATDEIELSASASTGYAFEGWSVSEGAGTCTGTTNPCKLPTNANKTVTAEFG